MLSDEEKKAIDNMKSLLLYSKQHEYFSPFQEQEIDDMNIVVNLIEKQSKEIELLKEENEKYKNPPFFDEDKYTENDKIKAKIEEYEEKIKKIKEKSVWEEPYDSEKYVRYTNYISVLQSLLEKE